VINITVVQDIEFWRQFFI